eukprot:2356782-Amphidinium_carterae.1
MLVCDSFSGFIACGLVTDHRSETLWRRFRESWMSWAGPPMKLVADQERGLVSHAFLDMASRAGVKVEPAAPYASWQKGKTERSIQTVKEILRRSISHVQAIGQEEMHERMVEAANGFNRRPGANGYPPSLIVFGMRLRLEDEHLGPEGVELHPEPTDKMLQRVNLRRSIEDAIAKTHAKEVVRRACAAKTRIPAEVEIGDTVYFYRVWNSTRQDKSRRAQKGEYIGPATVFGILHNRIWVQYGGHAYCVAREHIRSAGPEENSLRAGLVKEQLETFKQMVAEETYTDLTQQAPAEDELAIAAERVSQQVEEMGELPEINPMEVEESELEPAFQELANRLKESGSFTTRLPSGELAFGQLDAWRLPLPAAAVEKRLPLRTVWAYRAGSWAQLEDRIPWKDVNGSGLNPKADMLLTIYLPDSPEAPVLDMQPTAASASAMNESEIEEPPMDARERSRSPRGASGSVWLTDMEVEKRRIKQLEQQVLDWLEVHRPPKNNRHGQGLRTYVFGLYTRQGVGITQKTREHGQEILGCLHELAALGDGPSSYTTLVLNVLESSGQESPCVRLHQDKYNLEGSENCIMEMGTYEGGKLWLECQEGRTACPFDASLNGKWIHARHQWRRFCAKQRHCVTAVTKGLRVTIVATSVGRVTCVPDEIWSELASWGFPGIPQTKEVLATVRNTKPITKRMEKKMLDKEMIWSEIPEENRPLFIEAHNKEWKQWLDTECVRVLSKEESERVRHSVARERILPSDMKYRDKNASFRTPQNPLPVKAKARLCVAGQHEPDAKRGLSKTDAPTVQRASLMVFLQLATSLDWLLTLRCGDITGAFLQGESRQDKQPLYMTIPRQGLPGVENSQLLEIVKSVYGLPQAVRAWYSTFRRGIEEAGFVVHPLDPCMFMRYHPGGELGACLVIHVDDGLFVTDGSSSMEQAVEHIHQKFPFGAWSYVHEKEDVQYTGKRLRVVMGPDGKREVHMDMSSFIQ